MKARQQQKVSVFVSCANCKHATLMQSHKRNPVVAECDINHERYVAKVRRCCQSYKRTDAVKATLPMVNKC